MPYSTIRASATVPSEHAPEVKEIIDQAIDKIVIQNIPVADSEVIEECAEPPEEED